MEVVFELQEIQTVMVHYGSHKGVFLPYLYANKCQSLRTAIGMLDEEDESDFYYSPSSRGKCNTTIHYLLVLLLNFDYLRLACCFIFRREEQTNAVLFG